MSFYKGKEGQWSYVFHRVTGVGVLLFLLIHILDTMLISWGPEHYDKIIQIYRNPFFKINEIVLFAAVVYHALNGVRIILIDFWSQGARHQKKLFYVEMTLFALIMIPVTVIMLSHF